MQLQARYRIYRNSKQNSHSNMDNTINMYFLAEYNEDEQIIDGGNVYIVDREQDIEKIRSLNKKDIIFSGIATKSTYLPNPHIAGTEYYCITLNDIRAK